MPLKSEGMRLASAAERELWLAAQLEPEQSVFTTAHSFRFERGVNSPALAAAWQSLMLAIPLLSARFAAAFYDDVMGAEAALSVIEQAECAPALVWGNRANSVEVEHRLDEVRAMAFDVNRGPLCYAELLRDDEVGSDTLVIAISHLAADGYAWSIIVSELQSLYRESKDEVAVVRNDFPEPAPASDIDNDAEWATAYTATLPHPSRGVLPMRQSRPRAVRELPSVENLSQLPQLALGAAALAVAAGRESGIVTVDVPFLARSGVQLRVPATSMNVVPVAVDVSQSSARDFIERCMHALDRVRPHSHQRLEQARRARSASGSPVPLSDVAMNLIPFSLELTLDGMRSVGDTLSAGPGDVPAVSLRAHANGTFRVEVDAPASELCSAEEMSAHLADGFIAAFETLLRDERVGEAVNCEETSPDVLELIRDRAAEFPEHPAFIDGESRVVTTYRELWGAAGALAKDLRNRGIGQESLVGVCASRGPEYAVSVLGVLRAGGAFVPLPADAVDAASRRRIISAVQLDVIVDAGVARAIDEFAGIPTLNVPTISTEGLGAIVDSDCQEMVGVSVRPEQIAYVITTSGSTGEPKAVALSRGALSMWINAISEDYCALTACDRVVQFAAVQFDASIEELFGALCAGATLIPRTSLALEQPQAWLSECADLGVTMLDLPTGYWHELARILEAGSAQLPQSVHTVIIGGEAASAERVARWRETVGECVRLVNTYGPTEATVVATRHVLAGPPLR